MTDTPNIQGDDAAPPKKLVYNDKYHTYWLDGQRASGATTMAGWPDDNTSLRRWSEQQVLLGAAQQPHLLTEVATAGGDWKTLNGIAQKAMDAAKASVAADRGTVIHKVLELLVTGGPIRTDFTEIADIRDRWDRFVADHGITVDPAWCERFAIHPEHRLCGRSDLVATIGGRRAVLDWKTGPNAVKYPHKTAVQLAIYARAPWWGAVTAPDGDKTTVTEFEVNPGIDTDTAYVIEIPRDGGDWRLVPIDIHAGWDAFHGVVLPIRQWRARTDLVLTAPAPAPASPHPIGEHGPEIVTPTRDDTATPSPVEVPEVLLARINEFRRDQRKGDYARDNWPAGLPKVKDITTAAEIRLLEEYVTAVETRFGEPPFMPEDADPQILDLARRILKESGHAPTYLRWCEEAAHVGRPFKPDRDQPTARQAGVTLAAAGCLDIWGDDPDIICAAIRTVAPHLVDDVGPGVMFAMLGADTATRLYDSLHLLRDAPLYYTIEGATFTAPTQPLTPEECEPVPQGGNP